MDDKLLKQVVISKLQKEAAVPGFLRRLGPHLLHTKEKVVTSPKRMGRFIADRWRKYLIGAGITAGLGGGAAASVAALRGGDPVKEFAVNAPWGLIPMGPISSVAYPALYTAEDPTIGVEKQQISPIQLKKYQALQRHMTDTYELPNLPSL